MSESELPAEEPAEKKGAGRLLLIIGMAILLLLLIAATVAGTLFATGFFDSRSAVAVEQTLATLEADLEAERGTSAMAKPAASSSEPLRPRSVPDRERFEPSYLEMERALLANLANSRKVIQVKIAVMTYYDRRVLDSVERHDFALRSSMLDILRQVTEADLAESDFRSRLSRDLLLAINAVLEEHEDFGGVEAVHFTEFVIQ